MKYKIAIILILSLLSDKIISQTNQIINPKGTWFFGVEIGGNRISSYELGEPNKSFQGGVMSEYYTGKHWSIVGRVKFFKTGVSFLKQSTHTGSWFDLGTDGFYGQFNGFVVSIPIDTKYEYTITPTLKGTIKLGLAYNYETKSEYHFSSNLDTNNPRSFASLNAGLGLSYFISYKTAFYIDIETYKLGGYKANSSSDGSLNFWFPKNYYTTNSLLNFGIKYTFKKEKKTP